MPDSESLILKYRPSIWDEVVGQESAIKAIQNGIDTKSHGFLLSSMLSGVGKTTIARIIARDVGCEYVQEHDGASKNGVDDMREITDALRYKMSGKRAFIIDECHMLTKAAWNSILKSVEEPPEWAYWIFCTTDIGRVIDTIKTRCISVKLLPVNGDILYNMLSDIAQAEKFEASDQVIDLCVTEANGSPRQAISNLAKVFHLKDVREAAELLESAVASKEVIDLIKGLLDGAPWPKLQPILKQLAEINPESIRQQVRDYLTKVLMNTESESKASKLFQLLDHFSTPFPSGDGITPVALAVGHFLLAERI